MRRVFARCVTAAISVLPFVAIGVRAGEPATSSPGAPLEFPAVDSESVKGNLDWIGSPERNGRREWADRDEVSKFIAERFTKAGLSPVPGRNSMLIDAAAMPAPATPTEPGGPGAAKPDAKPAASTAEVSDERKFRDVLGWLPGAKAGTKMAEAGEYLIVLANYDHIGKASDGSICAGADGNASGVSALIEVASLVARAVKARGAPLSRSVLFAATDAKERGFFGSRLLAAGQVLPRANCAAAICLELLGRSMGDLVAGNWFVMGTENSAELEASTRALGAPISGEMGHVGTYFHFLDGDYTPFRNEKVPYVFLSAGESRDWQTSGDTSDKIDFAQLENRIAWIARLVALVADDPKRPTWREEGPPRIEEMKDLQRLIALAIEKTKALGLPPIAAKVIENFKKKLDDIVASGKVTELQRESIRATMVSLSQFARLIRPK